MTEENIRVLLPKLQTELEKASKDKNIQLEAVLFASIHHLHNYVTLLKQTEKLENLLDSMPFDIEEFA